MKTFEDFKDQALTHIIAVFEQKQEVMPTYLSGQSQKQEDDKPVFVAEVPASAVKGFGLPATLQLLKEMAAIEEPNFACLALQAQLGRVELRPENGPIQEQIEQMKQGEMKLEETLVLCMQNRLNRKDDALVLLPIRKNSVGMLRLSAPFELSEQETTMMGPAMQELRLI